MILVMLKCAVPLYTGLMCAGLLTRPDGLGSDPLDQTRPDGSDPTRRTGPDPYDLNELIESNPDRVFDSNPA